MLRKLRRELAVTFLLQALSMACAAAFQVLCARWLGVAGRGELALLVASAQITAMLFGLGLPGAISFYAASAPASVPLLARRQMGLLGVVAVGVSAALAIGRALGLPQALIGKEFWFAIYILGAVAQPAFARLTMAVGAVAVSNLASVVASAGSVLLLCALALVGHPRTTEAMAALSLATLGGAAVAVANIAARGSFRRTTVREPSWGSELRIGGMGFAATILGLLMFRIDLFLVAALGGGAPAVGLYSLGVLAAELLVRVPNWTATVLSPTVSAKPAEARRVTIALFWASIAFTGLAVLPVVLLPETIRWLVRVAAGDAFANVYEVLLAMMPRVIAQAGGAILFGNLAGRGYPISHPLGCAVGLVALVASDLLLIPAYGVVGAALGSGIGYFAAAAVAFRGFLVLNEMKFRDFNTETMEQLARWRRGVGDRFARGGSAR